LECLVVTSDCNGYQQALQRVQNIERYPGDMVATQPGYNPVDVGRGQDQRQLHVKVIATVARLSHPLR